ncbi:MAG: hypothetical protein DRN25_04945 [Thermoplasmata archaeon]|nr:MAG: hypothetical protein DRN25_04945 [Thermoplasmata archaeon]
MKGEIGFVKANVYRFKILEILNKEQMDKNKISKKLRIREKLVEKTLSELEIKKLIKKENRSYKITEKGKKIFNQLRQF